MQLFRFGADKAPISFFIFLFACDLTIFFLVSNIWIILGWTVLTLFSKVCSCSWNHHHQHLATFYNPILNRLLELVYAFHTGITTNAWVLHHNLGHHLNYLDQKKDESGWARKDGSVMGEWEYTFIIAITGYWRAFKVGRRHPKYQPGFLSMGTLFIALTALLLYLNWLSAILIFGIPMLVGYLTTCWHTYSHHAGLETDDHFEASHNIMHRFYNFTTGNLGYHTAHHLKPGLHWSMLPGYHATIEHKIPAHLFVDPPIPYKWFSREIPIAKIALYKPST